MTTNTDKHELDIPEALKRTKTDKHGIAINTPLSNVPSSGSGANRSSFITPKNGNVSPVVVTRFKAEAAKKAAKHKAHVEKKAVKKLTAKPGESVTSLVKRFDKSEKPKAKGLMQSRKTGTKKTAARNGSKLRTSVRVAETGKITVLAKENPKREGSKAHDWFELYAKAKTVEDYIRVMKDRSQALAAISWDRRHGFIRVS